MDGTDINDVFDDITLSENKFTDIGFTEGFEAGKKQSYSDGDSLGRERGSQIGTEIGFYIGFIEEYRKQFENQQESPKTKKSEKIISIITKIDTLVSEFPDFNCKEGFEEKLEKIRASFKLLCSLLNISSEFNKHTTAW